MSLDLDDLERRLDEGYGLNDSQERALLAEVRRLRPLLDGLGPSYRAWYQHAAELEGRLGLTAPAPSATGEAMTQRQDALLHGKWADLKASKMAALIQTAPSATHWLTPRDFQGGPLPYPCPYMGPRGAMQAARWGAFPESSR